MTKTPIIPVYLNQTNVFDMVAMLSGGIAKVTNVNTVKSESNNTSDELNAGFGIGPALSSLFTVDLSANKRNEAGKTATKEVGEERVHTPASLLFQLKALLEAGEFLETVSNQNLPAPGAIVELEVTLSRSPVVEALDTFVELLRVAKVFDAPKPQQHKKGQPKTPNQYEEMITQLSTLLKSLKSGNTLDLIGKPASNDFQAVITLDSSFLNDPFMMDLIDGQFRVLGKVVRRIDHDDEPIGLLRKTAISKAPEIVTQLMAALGGLDSTGIFTLPDATVEVEGPAIQIIPIAIYA